MIFSMLYISQKGRMRGEKSRTKGEKKQKNPTFFVPVLFHFLEKWNKIAILIRRCILTINKGYIKFLLSY